MDLSNLFALFGAMVILAIIPGPAVFAIIARSMTTGFASCLFMTLGIVTADYIFIILALSGLYTLAETMGTAFIVIKYLSAAYLIWLGYKMLTKKIESVDIDTNIESSGSSFVAGLLLTLGNPKAILFYIGFFPAFVEIGNIHFFDVLSILLVTTVAIGAINIAYAYLAIKAKKAINSPSISGAINKTASTVMICTGVMVATRA